MKERHEFNETVDEPSAPGESLDAGLAAGFGKPADPHGTIDHDPAVAAADGSHPAGDQRASDFPTVPGYQVLREIARGGMGCVLAARDLTLDRDVALKILLPGANADRFVRESKITARLPHPGIPPVHALGTLADGSPFLAMKLIAGQTLADEMKSADRPRLLQVFTQVCQAVGFAHSRGVIHRDLKPANIMVGAFGEVQVMDWGLAKDLRKGEGGRMKDEDEEEQTIPDSSFILHPSSFEETQAGQVIGTPAYMAPEQARGETADARADVFALGGILCAILTGKPPYGGKSAQAVIQVAAAADLAEANARIDGCGADEDLVSLCRRCLSANPTDRPADGQAVADAMTAYLDGVQERLQTAERERAVALAREAEQRKRRKVQLALAASVLALMTLGGVSTMYVLQQRAAQAAAGQNVINRVMTLRDQALEHPEEIPRWQTALNAVKQADSAGDANTSNQLLSLQEEIQAGLDTAKRDQTLKDKLVDIRSAKGDDPDGSATDRAYADAFRAAGIDIKEGEPGQAAAWITARPESVRQALVAALDHWTTVRHGRNARGMDWRRLVAVARAADPDRDRNALRAALVIRPLAAVTIQKTLKDWQTDHDLAAVRDDKELARLPSAEQTVWVQLWSDVEALRQTAADSGKEETLKGTLTAVEREHAHEWKMKAGTNYAIEMASRQFDTYLRLENTQKKVLAENDDIDLRAKNLNSRIYFTPKKDGVYRIIATSYQQRGQGAYTLVIREFRKEGK